jgi:hypothetical protein
VCKLVRLLWLLVVTSYKRSINPIINPEVEHKSSQHGAVTCSDFIRGMQMLRLLAPGQKVYLSHKNWPSKQESSKPQKD